MTPERFIAKWRNVTFGEKQASQEMFLDICQLVEHPSPGDWGIPDFYTFEKWVPGGFADVYYEGYFGWEFKGDDRDLDAGLNQLLRYQVYLKTPPLLIVSSFQTIRIRTNFTNTETVLYEIPVAELNNPENLELLRQVFYSPSDFRPDRTRDAVTKATADLFSAMVSDMEQRPVEPEKFARYLNQIMFCLYAEDAGLLPDNVFSETLKRCYRDPAAFDRAVRELFSLMATGGQAIYHTINYFNGDLFKDADTVPLSGRALLQLFDAAQQDWRNIEPSIFGTLFERALDASKRSQLGAHYTGANDIELVVEPVVMEPLHREWDTARQKADALIGYDNAAARRILDDFRQRLAAVTVLDPACGSGNFLYIALRSLLDLEKEVIDFNDAQGWTEMHPMVKPNQMLGLEINPYAAELARTSLWIGYIQWHYANGLHYGQSPILTPLDNIRNTDAILSDGNIENPSETEWPAAEFIIGNPPFLGRGGLRNELGDAYTNSLYSVFNGRIPNASDLCCYWFEKARAMIDQGNAKRAGLLATQGIRGKDNRKVLQNIKKTGDIFMAYPDLEWTLDGATVHISIVGFDDGSESGKTYNGKMTTGKINSDLTVGPDTTSARILAENRGKSFQGPSPKAPFDIPPKLASAMLAGPLNVNGRPNSDVVRPVLNARDIVQRSRGMYTIDFNQMSLEEAARYEMPFEYVKEHVYPIRQKKSQAQYRNKWWQYATSSPNMRQALQGLTRYIATPRVSKHRIFVWIEGDVMCNDGTDVFAFDEDYFFGILHSRLHEVWSLVKGTQLREAVSGFRYTPTTCFETFPFPKPTQEQRDAIAAAAYALNQYRENWREGDDTRTLTDLYNRRPAWLDNAHAALDAAVSAAYGWPADLDDAAILERLLSLNLERSE